MRTVEKGSKLARRILTDKSLRKFYRLLSAPMTDFDCGRLCSPGNDGVPECCDIRTTYPSLYVDEYRWLRRKSHFWKRLVPRTEEARKLARELHESSILATCPGPAECKRGSRAIVCRIFPFEPHLDRQGKVLGLTFNYEMADRCPLIGRPESTFNPKYIRNSIQFWKELLPLIPEEQQLYIDESARLRRRFRRKGRRVAVFTGDFV
jgi:hypothetical protein